MSYDGGHTYTQQHQQFNTSVSTPTMPSGKNDLEILEKLKAQIKAGQHERFQPKPAPGALLKIYQDGIKAQGAPHPQQGPEGHAMTDSKKDSHDARSTVPGETGSKAIAHDASHRPPPIQSQDTYDSKGSADPFPVSASQSTIKVLSSLYRFTHKCTD